MLQSNPALLGHPCRTVAVQHLARLLSLDAVPIPGVPNVQLRPGTGRDAEAKARISHGRRITCHTLLGCIPVQPGNCQPSHGHHHSDLHCLSTTSSTWRHCSNNQRQYQHCHPNCDEQQIPNEPSAASSGIIITIIFITTISFIITT